MLPQTIPRSFNGRRKFFLKMHTVIVNNREDTIQPTADNQPL